MRFKQFLTCTAGICLLGANLLVTSCKKDEEAVPEEVTATASNKSTAQTKATISWYLVRASNPTADQQDAYNRITTAMNAAVSMYNQQTTYCSGNLRVEYNTGVPTADGSSNGTIRFGANRSYMTQRCAQHEIAHTQGVGTTTRWTQLRTNGKYTGAYGLQMIRSMVGESPSSTINADGHSFWPYGLNYESEWVGYNGARNARIVGAMQRDGV